MLVGVYDYTAESLFMDMPLQKMILQFLAGTNREKIHYNTKIEESGLEAKHSLNGWLGGWLATENNLRFCCIFYYSTVEHRSHEAWQKC